MNCKPGDLAMVVRVFSGRDSINLGTIVRVVTPVKAPWDGSPGWIVERPMRNGCTKCCDICLRPIRDPGEDAQDETLQWLPVPTKELA